MYVVQELDRVTQVFYDAMAVNFDRGIVVKRQARLEIGHDVDSGSRNAIDTDEPLALPLATTKVKPKVPHPFLRLEGPAFWDVAPAHRHETNAPELPPEATLCADSRRKRTTYVAATRTASRPTPLMPKK
jgi:hypothetical protein